MKDGVAVKFAVTVLFALTVITHVAPLGASQPVQPAFTEPGPAVAVRVTGVPDAYASKQSVPQFTPVPVTRPKPVPPFATVRPKLPTGVSLSLIVPTACASAIGAFTAADRFTKNVSVGS